MSDENINPESNLFITLLNKEKNIYCNMTLIQKIKPIHPFAARMAPEIAFEALNGLPKNSVVLDSMTGSGTVMRTISELGYQGIGFDIDPLSVLMSKAWTNRIENKSFINKSDKIFTEASKLRLTDISLPWIDRDQPTKDFIKFWFAPSQIRELRKLSYLLTKSNLKYSSLYKIALSRLIITKTSGASLAADVSHSRPHRVKVTNDFEVLEEFRKSCRRVADSLNSEKLIGKIRVYEGDARRLSRISDNSIDAIITSPPYLNALDYMRGHKLSLVWLGHKVNDLSMIRGGSVGAEKAPTKNANLTRAKELAGEIKDLDTLPDRIKNMIFRYSLDIEKIIKESARVLKKKHNATFVIGNSSLKGIFIDNTSIAKLAARRHGLALIESKEREIPENKRYLPPPNKSSNTGLDARMRTETIMTFKK